ncbi:MAG: SufD family Fe-S cluster assembly protein [Myxococcota bacterium]
MQIRVKAGESLTLNPSPATGEGLEIELEARAHLSLTQVTFCEGEQAQNWRVTFLGEHASCNLNFLDLVKQSGHLRTSVEVFHNVPNCKSRQLHKGLYADDAQGFLKAYVAVPFGALGTDAGQLHRSLLLSPNARVHAEPHLEINADAVQCRHGASIGQLDASALFYMKARGLNEVMAKRLLIQAFAGEVLQSIDDTAMRDELTQQVFAWI